jgi:hypothetical protein
MVTQNVFRLSRAAAPVKSAPGGFFSRILESAMRFIARLMCGLHGHVILLHFEPNKLSLQCALCGYESEGWEVGHPQPLRVREAHASMRRLENRGPALQPLNQRMAS